MEEKYDLIIVGGGPGGYSAAIYAARYNLKTLVIVAERGGLVTKTHLIENYPGVVSLTGPELMEKIENHVNEYDVDIVDDFVDRIKKEKDIFTLTTLNSKKIIYLKQLCLLLVQLGGNLVLRENLS